MNDDGKMCEFREIVDNVHTKMCLVCSHTLSLFSFLFPLLCFLKNMDDAEQQNKVTPILHEFFFWSADDGKGGLRIGIPRGHINHGDKKIVFPSSLVV